MLEVECSSELQNVFHVLGGLAHDSPDLHVFESPQHIVDVDIQKDEDGFEILESLHGWFVHGVGSAE